MLLRMSSIAVAVVFTLSGCYTPSNISLTSNINDFVMMGIKSSKDNPRFVFSSKIADGNIKPYERDRIKPIPSHPGYNVRQASTLKRMLTDFMTNKYPGLNQDSLTTIAVSLDDFWIEMYTEATSGQQFSTAMFGGETEWILSARLKATVIIRTGEKESVKVITTSAEDKFIRGVGTGTKTSNIHQGGDSPEAIHARNINSANNKLLMLLNTYLQDNGL